MPVSIRAMFLRSITIRGFKSFADKTVLEFVPGVSVIVGPNGSGKSNLVDAISWALGEQGPRALRGGQMADDNFAGKIPVPMSEIEIARTIFRSGDSEYRIGGQVVRLMDVQELLSETGIGRALHTVVGQGQLEEELLARPEDRRRYIEEAAGIAKHRKRKERAERKLAGLDQRREARERLDALDSEVLTGADARAEATTALADAERTFRGAAIDRERAEQTYRAAVDRETTARQALASEATVAARMDTVAAELGRVDEAVGLVVADLERSETELEAAEDAHRQAEDERHQIEEQRRRIGEEAASRRAEADAIRGTLASAEHEQERLGGALEALRERIATAEAARDEIEADIEHLDGQTAPLAERRRQLDDERRTLVDRIEQLTDARVRMQARKDLLDARRRDIEETPGSRFLAAHGGRAVGLLKSLVRIEDGLERALVAALGPLADAVVYDDGALALADAPQGDGAILAIAAGGPVPVGLPGERQLLAAVDADPAARGIVSTVLRDVYLAASVEEAARKQRAHPDASFVTAEGVLVGPAVIHTAREADVRLREILAELQVLAHDLSATDQQLRPRATRLDEIGGEVTFLQEQIDAADAEITDAAGRSNAAERELVAMRTEADLLAQRLAAVSETATT